jgi:hypothetical protein
MGYFLLGVVLLVAVLLAARSFVNANPANLAQAARAFVAAFSALAGTGLLFAGRFGLALIAIGATIVAIRALKRGPGGFGMGRGSSERAQDSSEVVTETLRMQLDHASGSLEGEVLRGRFSGRTLDSLGLSDILELLADCQREDPRSVPLLETYLDRRQADWRGHVDGEDEPARPAPPGGMDEATAWSILGLSPGASADEIKAAHRRLMTRLHPDHGGSGYLAAQLNEAKDLLLRRQR